MSFLSNLIGSSTKVNCAVFNSYLCEQGFSSMFYGKNKYRTRMIDLDSSMPLKLTKIIIRTEIQQCIFSVDLINPMLTHQCLSTVD